jgi:17 kDa outer membrane surface antigen
MPDQLIYRTDPPLTRSHTRSPSAAGVVGAVVSGLLLFAAGGCSLPISIPLGPMGDSSSDTLITGSIGPRVDAIDVDEEGVSERIGTGAWVALKRAVAAASETADDGQTFAWSSNEPGSPHPTQGTVTAIDAFFAEDGAVCRRLAITATAYLRSDTFIADACRRSDGGWNVRPVEGGAHPA